MRRFAILGAVLVVVLALLANPAVSLAQDAATADPAVGVAVPFVGQDGAEQARLTVEEVVDPFDGYDDSYTPDRGSRYLLVRFTIENAGSRPLAIDPSAFAVQDADGFLAFPASIALQEDLVEQTPLLEYGELEGGASLTGSAAFQVFNGVDPVRVVYQPSRERLVVLADLRAGVDAGSAAAVDNTDANDDSAEDEAEATPSS
jgi:hypothetical protein